MSELHGPSNSGAPPTGNSGKKKNQKKGGNRQQASSSSPSEAKEEKNNNKKDGKKTRSEKEAEDDMWEIDRKMPKPKCFMCLKRHGLGECELELDNQSDQKSS